MTFEKIRALLLRRIDEILSPIVKGINRYSLFDFPSYSNIGDSAIWLGEMIYLRKSVGKTPDITCDLGSYSKQRIESLVDDGAIFLSGGGNLGDLWVRHQEFRERVIEDFPDNPIVQLPQSIYFQESAALIRFQDIIAAHKDFTLMVRDERSMELAENAFECRVLECPDMAFVLSDLPRFSPECDVFCLLRTDIEAAQRSDVDYSTLGSVRTDDWIAHQESGWYRVEQKMSRVLSRYPRALSFLSPHVTDPIRSRAAKHHLLRGCAMLSQGRYVLTDRLHGHILSVLMGIPHVIMDNSYGKVGGFYRHWTHECEDVLFAQSVTEAKEALRSMMARHLP